MVLYASDFGIDFTITIKISKWNLQLVESNYVIDFWLALCKVYALFIMIDETL